MLGLGKLKNFCLFSDKNILSPKNLMWNYLYCIYYAYSVTDCGISKSLTRDFFNIIIPEKI